MIQLSLNYPKTSSGELAEMIASKGSPSVYHITIWRHLKERGVNKWIVNAKSMLTVEHKRKRVARCLENRHRDWKNIQHRLERSKNINGRIYCSNLQSLGRHPSRNGRSH